LTILFGKVGFALGLAQFFSVRAAHATRIVRPTNRPDLRTARIAHHFATAPSPLAEGFGADRF